MTGWGGGGGGRKRNRRRKKEKKKTTTFRSRFYPATDNNKMETPSDCDLILGQSEMQRKLYQNCDPILKPNVNLTVNLSDCDCRGSGHDCDVTDSGGHF